MSSWFRTTFAALWLRDYRILWFGTLFSFVAFFMSTVVQGVVAFDLAGTNRAVGSVVFAQGIGMVLLPLGGVIADRWPKRRVVVTGQLVAATVFALLAGLLAVDRISIAALIAGSLVMGATFAFLGPARQALVIDLVPPEIRGNAMAVNLIANTTSRVIGPAVAGILLAWKFSGATGAYATMAAFYALSALSIAWLPRSVVRSDALDRPVLGDIRDGLQYVASHPRLRLLLVFFVTVILLGFPHVTVLPGLVENGLGRDAKEVSALFLAAAAGALLSSVAVARFADSPHALVLYSSLALAFGASLVLLAAMPSIASAIGAMFLTGAASGGFQALNVAVIARETEPQFIGRVMALTMLAFAGFGLMALPIGLLADAIGERAALATMGIAVGIVSVVLAIALARVSGKSDPEPDPGP